MAQWHFTEYSDIQAFVTISHLAGKDELFVNVSNEEPRILLSIQENDEDKGNFQLNATTAQRLFDWLKAKGIVV